VPLRNRRDARGGRHFVEHCNILAAINRRFWLDTLDDGRQLAERLQVIVSAGERVERTMKRQVIVQQAACSGDITSADGSFERSDGLGGGTAMYLPRGI